MTASGDWSRLASFDVVRLNSELFPVGGLEADLYERFGLRPREVEANTPETIIPHVAECDALFAVSVALPREVIDSLRNCRLISRLGTGTDKIDVARATERGIVVSNVPEFGVEDMADHTMAMVLSLQRRLPWMHRRMLRGEFFAARSETLTIRRPGECVLGLVGFGASARAVAARALPFGFRLLATRRNMQAPTDEADRLQVRMVDLPTLLRESDYVSLHLPLDAGSYHLLNEAAIALMKPGAFLVNTSRGAIVDERALAAALREGRLAGAGIDTFEGVEIFTPDERPPDHPLVGLDNVILSPHVSGLSRAAERTCANSGVRNLVCALSGCLPPAGNIVNRSVVPRVPLAPYDPGLFDHVW